MNILSRLALAAIATLSAAAFPPIASATPGQGVSAVVLSQTTLNGQDRVLREITIAPGGSTGWHWHDGNLFGVIRQGTLTHNLADCSIDGIYGPGDAITEPSGPDHAHIGRNLGPTPVLMQIVYINPAGSPLSRDAHDPGCGYA
ncbi:cupin [Mycobacterium haemophilum DSM 44634]|uniref:cupin domain-containing protein n=1 Tax=Mycobacterium haemophilum TaxID=29311 RepID=UPI000656070B|nr:cupin domain-containing protein [Mycobacterium haemophilum]AKN18308.1 cupin [Mycobacterium haemophilum DSM 44634]MCV7342753.1 cupin domain-containing protein [Mycobacterium haemophilum DSM 44634]